MKKSVHSRESRVFVALLEAARKRAGLTQAQVAKAVAWTQSAVSKVERGERRLDILELRQFCRAFGVSLVDFVAELDKDLRRA